MKNHLISLVIDSMSCVMTALEAHDEIGFGDGKQLFDLTSYTRHLAEDGTSDLLSKGVYTDKARGYVKGLIDIPYEGRGTDSFLGEFSMILQRTARSVTIPSLEIDQPDCRRAMHSSSVGPIDETQIFYLMSRGLTENEAQNLIVQGFLEVFTKELPMEYAIEFNRLVKLEMEGSLG